MSTSLLNSARHASCAPDGRCGGQSRLGRLGAFRSSSAFHDEPPSPLFDLDKQENNNNAPGHL
ncbi:hypothetical protein VCV18_011771 [Metarhizium anisopliae]